MNIGMVGLGKLGKVIATSIAYKGHSVMGYDINPNNMALTHSEIEDGPNGEYNGFHAILAKSSLKFGTLQEVVDHSEIIFVGVQTPHDPKFDGTHSLKHVAERKDFDYTFLKDAINNINACSINKPKVVCIISTVLPTTIRTYILPLITNRNIKVTYSPSTPAMGTCMKDYLNPEFVLIGQIDLYADNKLQSFYKTMYPDEVPIMSMSLESAELTKVIYNLFITTKITYANTIMEICDKIKNCNCDDVVNTLSKATNRLISPKYLRGGMGDSMGCLPQGSYIYTEHGMKEIEHIKIGDKVLTVDGSLQKVLNTFKREFKGNIYKIKPRGLLPVCFTEEHPIYVKKDIRPQYKTNGKLKYKNYTDKNFITTMMSPPEYLEAHKISTEYYSLFPVPKQEATIEVPKDITETFIKLAGYYLSEGHLEYALKKSGKFITNVGFSFNKNELQFINEVHSLIKLECPTRNPKIYNNKKNCSTVKVYAPELAQKLYDYFGVLSYNKFIPNWILYGPIENGINLLRGLLNGDGSSHEEGISFSTTSKQLAFGVSILLKRLNIVNTITEHPLRVGKKDKVEHKKSFDVEISNAFYIEKAKNLLDKPIKHKMQSKQYPNITPIKDGFYHHKIEKTEIIDYEGYVYNFEVEGNNSYITECGIVHNCHPRDLIAMSHLANKYNISGNMFEYLTLTREAQAEYLVDKVYHWCLPIQHNTFFQNPIVIGTAGKANVKSKAGSCALLIKELFNKKYKAHHCQMKDYDPYINPSDIQFLNDKNVYLIGINHDIFKTWVFPEDSIIIDPFRMVPPSPAGINYKVVHVGVS